MLDSQLGSKTGSGPASPPGSCSFFQHQNLAGITCDNTGLSSVGLLFGGSFTAAGDGVWNTTWAWSNGNKTLTGTITSLVAGSNAVTAMAGTWTTFPSNTPEAGQPLVKSASTLVNVCAANTSATEGLPQPGTTQANFCRPTTATHF